MAHSYIRQNLCGHHTRLSKTSFVGFHMARPLATSSLAVAASLRNRPLRGQKRLAPLAKRSTCNKSNTILAIWYPQGRSEFFQNVSMYPHASSLERQ